MVYRRKKIGIILLATGASALHYTESWRIRWREPCMNVYVAAEQAVGELAALCKNQRRYPHLPDKKGPNQSAFKFI